MKYFLNRKKNLNLVAQITTNQKHIITMNATIDLHEELDFLTQKLTGDMFQDMDIKDEIHNLEMKIKGIKPMDSHFDCIGCGS